MKKEKIKPLKTTYKDKILTIYFINEEKTYALATYEKKKIKLFKIDLKELNV